MSFQKTYDVRSLECDSSDHLNLWGLARFYQDIAEAHAMSIGNGFHDLIKQNKAWIICRMYIHIDEMPFQLENITLKTWMRNHNGLLSMRDYQLINQEGRVVSGSTCCWAIIDYTTRRVCRLNNLIGNYECEPEMATEFSELDKLKSPNMDEDDCVVAFSVLPSFLDHTNHVNNAEYLRLASDYMPNGLQNIKNTDIRIDFIAETPPNDEMKIYRKQIDQSTWFQIHNSRGASAIVQITR